MQVIIASSKVRSSFTRASPNGDYPNVQVRVKEHSSETSDHRFYDVPDNRLREQAMTAPISGISEPARMPHRIALGNPDNRRPIPIAMPNAPLSVS
jgi:hypothetical protein